MLSYRHGFHAGNHADVLKHLVFVQLLRAMTHKEKPLYVIDTHAGAGRYSLERGYAVQNAEFESGIGRLWERNGMTGVLADYVAQVRAINPDGVLRNYPGSPQLALQLTREQDRLRFFERHSKEGRALQTYLRGAGRRVSVVVGDGFAGLKSMLPPPSRRGLVLIDPSYEVKSDYAGVLTAMRDSLARFETGTYAVWYPHLQRRESRDFPERLRRLARVDWLHVWLDVSRPAAEGFGLHGSGMFVFNPPWKMEDELRAALPALSKALRGDDEAAFGLDSMQT